MDTPEANRAAVDGNTLAVARALKRLGMKQCSERLVQYQFKPGAARHDWYGLFWRWWRALWIAHRAGAEFLFEDFCARVSAVRDAEGLRATSLGEQLDRCEYQHYRFAAAAARSAPRDEIIRLGVEEIVEKRKLVWMLTAEAAREASPASRAGSRAAA
jgi:hypothetical protein